MEFELNLVICRSGHRPRLALVVAAIVFLSLAFATQAQSIQLSAEQQRMLDQLPPEQRQQAMDALRRQQDKQTAPSQESINETLSAATGSSDSVLEEDDDGERKAEGRSRLVLRFDPLETLTDTEIRELEEDPVSQKLLDFVIAGTRGDSAAGSR
jgi:hypothetical protein